jgi:hypothetical protein
LTIQSWLDDCTSRHQVCKSYQCAAAKNLTTKDRLPKRLLDVGPPDGSESPKLVLGEHIASNNQLQYTALSHCWGQATISHPLKTTTANEAAHRKAVSIDDLPPTFRDAVTVTRRLNVRYLWIDSLCIIQNDLRDWQSEASKMAAIFEGAYMTIAATSSPDSRGGLFFEVSNSQLRVGHQSGDDAETFIIRYPTADRDTLWLSPLNSRGWVLQELALSCRTVHFTNSILYWQCRERYASEDGLLDDHTFGSLEEEFDWVDKEFYLEYFAKSPRIAWYQLAHNYSERALSFMRDKLPAMAGLVQAHQIQTGATPVLGLWKDTLYLDLDWRVDDPSHSQASLQNIPSWTWLSSHDVITYEGVVAYTSGQREFSPKLNVVDWSVQWEDEPFTSELVHWHLAVRGPFGSCKIPKGTLLEKIAEEKEVQAFLGLSADGLMCYTIQPDALGRVDHDTVSFLHLFTGEALRLYFLVLLPVQGKLDTYRRVGSGTIGNNMAERILLNSAPERTIFLD